jgi:predicted metal-dependent RNase
MFAEERRGFFEDSGHVLGGCVDHDHLGNIDDIVPVLFLGQKSFVDLQLLQVNARKVLPLILQFDHLLSVLFVPEHCQLG